MPTFTRHLRPLLLSFGLASLVACASEADDASVPPPDAELGQVSQAMCYPVPQPAVSEVIPKLDCAPAAGSIQATAPVGYTKQACTSFFMVEGIEDTHSPGCHFSEYFAAYMKTSDVPTNQTYCTQSYVDHDVIGYANGSWVTLHNARTYGVWNSGYCLGVTSVGWTLHDAGTLPYTKFRFLTHAYKMTASGLVEAGVSVKIQEGL